MAYGLQGQQLLVPDDEWRKVHGPNGPTQQSIQPMRGAEGGPARAYDYQRFDPVVPQRMVGAVGQQTAESAVQAGTGSEFDRQRVAVDSDFGGLIAGMRQLRQNNPYNQAALQRLNALDAPAFANQRGGLAAGLAGANIGGRQKAVRQAQLGGQQAMSQAQRGEKFNTANAEWDRGLIKDEASLHDALSQIRERIIAAKQRGDTIELNRLKQEWDRKKAEYDQEAAVAAAKAGVLTDIGMGAAGLLGASAYIPGSPTVLLAPIAPAMIGASLGYFGKGKVPMPDLPKTASAGGGAGLPPPAKEPEVELKLDWPRPGGGAAAPYPAPGARPVRDDLYPKSAW